MTVLESDVLSDLIGQKRRCLEHLSALGRKQFDLVRVGNMTDLLHVLAAKQQVLAEMQRVERGLDPFRNQDPEARVWSSPERRGQCAAEAADCERLLAQIIVREKESETALVRRRDEAAAQLEGTRSAKVARASYMARSHVATALLDLASE
jgi:hypothetical protein